MKKVLLILLSVLLLTACGQDKENDQEAGYLSITAEEARKLATNIKEFGGIIDWPYEVMTWI